ncbi:MAG TPA: hypothetical protein VMT86_06975 [Bryobacteraceae bacterium]|nr:hypothetical protein [Bryobacteraceae bacterium]
MHAKLIGRTILWALAYGVAAGQTCNVQNPTNCANTGLAAGPPTLQSFVAGAALSLPAARTAATAQSQPHMLLSAQVVPASQSYMTNDPKTCPSSGTCLYNNSAVMQGYINSLANARPSGVGLTSVDVNMWMGPLFESTQYLAAGSNDCGTYGQCYTPGATNAGWYTRSLGTYDTLFSYAHTAKHLRVRVAPTPTADVLSACGIATGYGNFTVAQMEACLIPLYAAAASRYWIDDFTVVHEVCGVWELMLNTAPYCALSVADADTFVRTASAAIRAASANPNIQIGAGAIIPDAGGSPYSCTNSGNYWCDWTTVLMPANVLDFAGLDVYPDSSLPASQYYSKTLPQYATMAAQVPSNKLLWANESSPLRWTPLAAGVGESGTYWGCGYLEWLTDGTFSSWVSGVVGAWGPANHFYGWSIFPSEPLIYLSSDPNNTHCMAGSDGYDPLVMSNLGNVSAEGLMYAAIASGHSAALEGNAHITGRARLGH